MQAVFGLERIVDMTIARQVPQIAYGTTVGIRFMNNIIGAYDCICSSDMARTCVQSAIYLENKGIYAYPCVFFKGNTIEVYLFAWFGNETLNAQACPSAQQAMLSVCTHALLGSQAPIVWIEYTHVLAVGSEPLQSAPFRQEPPA
eukprot:231598-Pelagomonas_calceolata.AAC.10